MEAFRASLGIDRLYSHQSKAIASALQGKHVHLSTSTASGKSACFLAPVLQSLLYDDDARAIFIFPTKALAHDQLCKITRLLEENAGLGDAITASAFDGDTPFEQRTFIRESSRILLTNPDMLHVTILPNHRLWKEFLRGLRYVIVDEVHTYSGVFGSHVANIVRRLRRILAAVYCNSRVQFITCSATIGAPNFLLYSLRFV